MPTGTMQMGTGLPSRPAMASLIVPSPLMPVTVTVRDVVPEPDTVATPEAVSLALSTTSPTFSVTTVAPV